MSFYLKYRPKKFSDIVSQEHITDIIKAQLKQKSLNNNYIFFGSRGTGKTTIARILTKALNCLNSDGTEPCGECENCKLIESNKTLDFIEIDAASHTQVDHIREEILDKAIYPPTKLKKKIYLIDEVHMLSKSSFNALLKIMEEPPEYLIFILATTEIEKIPETILSRCQIFNFKKISTKEIIKRLEFICKDNNINYQKNALELIAKVSDGVLRDPIKHIEQVSILGDINEENVTKFLGVAPETKIVTFLDLLEKKSLEKVFDFLDEIKQSGIDLNNFIKQILLHIDKNFLENPKKFSEIAQIAENILFKIKKHPYPILIYKLEIYNFLKDETKDSLIGDTSKKTSNQKETNPKNKEEKTDVNNKNTKNNNNIQNKESKVEKTKNNTIQNATNLQESLLENMGMGPLKSSFKKYAKIASIKNDEIQIIVLNEIQYKNVFTKEENFQYIKNICEKILDKQMQINFKLTSPEEYLKENT